MWQRNAVLLPRKEYPYIEHTRGFLRMAKGFRIFRLFRFVFFQYFNQLYDLGIPLWNPASISSSDTWSCAITRLTILIQISQAMSIQQWAKVARFQHVSTAEGQNPHAAAVRQQFRHPLWQGVSKDKRSKLSCCKATLAKSDSCRVIVLEAWTEETVNYCTVLVYYIHVFLFLVECYLWLPAVDQMLCGFNGSEKPLQ